MFEALLRLVHFNLEDLQFLPQSGHLMACALTGKKTTKKVPFDLRLMFLVWGFGVGV
jgi:hypothetical protein